MSAPTPRAQRGGTGTSFRGAARTGATTSPSVPRGGSTRGTARGGSSRGRGRGRGGTTAAVTGAGAGSNPEGLLQSLRTGSVRRSSASNPAVTRGRGHSNAPRASSTPQGRGRESSQTTFSKSFGESVAAVNQTPSFGAQTVTPSTDATSSSSYAGFMQDMTSKWTSLKQKREAERARAIRDGFLADPEKKTSLDKAITPVGTCTEMCAPFERAERIVQQMVDKVEKVPDSATGRDMPLEERMVKRFRRSAAGNDEQLPSDIRTPETLKKTLNYLFDDVIGGPERLASIHKFVWDRTRAIRNDFSIQQVTKTEDVKIAVECYERIARFHILSLHQLSNPNQLLEGENFDAHQEREQLNNTLLSLMYYYDDNRNAIPFPNEPEFRAYCIIFEIQSQHPDLEDRMQAWPSQVLQDKRVQTAFKLYTAAGNTLFDQGPLRPMTSFSVAQNNSGAFWTLLNSNAVSYIMACVAELYFAHVRFASLDALWRSGKGAPQAQQAKNTEWTLSEVTEFLAFDTDEQTLEFCAAFNLTFGQTASGEQHLDFTALSTSNLDKSSIPAQQVFSHSYVEPKRYRRTFVAVMNGLSAAQAIRYGMVEAAEEEKEEENQQSDNSNDEQSLFIPEKPISTPAVPATTATPRSVFGGGLNPQAMSFTSKFGTSTQQPFLSTKFGDSATVQNSIFGQQSSASTSAGLKSESSPLFGDSVSRVSPFGLDNRASVKKTATDSIAFSNQPPKQDSVSTFGTAPFPAFSFIKPSTNGLPTLSAFAASPGSNAGHKSLPDAAEKPSVPAFDFAQPSTTPFKPSTQDPNSQISDVSSAPPISTPSTATPERDAPVFTFQRPNNSEQSPFQFTAPSVTKGHTSSSSSQSSEVSSARPLFSLGTTTQPQTTVVQPATSAQAPFSFTSTPTFATKAFSPVSQPIETSTPALSQVQGPISLPQQDTATTKVSIDVRPNSTPIPTVSDSWQKPTSQAVSAIPPRSATPPHSPRQQPSKPVSSTADKDRLVAKVSHLALCQQGGLLQEYLEYILPNLLKDVVRQHEDEVRTAAILRVKTQFLFRKFGTLWKQIFWRNNLNRRATKRRQLFSETMRVQHEKRKRDDQELEDILTAAQEKKRIQAEIIKNQSTSKDNFSWTSRQEKETQKTGAKRKDFSNSLSEDANESLRERGVKQHKRSRTMSSVRFTPVQAAQAQNLSTSGSFRTSIFSGKSSITQPAGTNNLSSSQIRAKQDATQTDYFRLLALGVDPRSPLVPLTDAEVKLQRQKEARAKEKVISDAWNRGRIIPDSGASGPPQRTLPKSASPNSSVVSASRSTSVATPDPESADLLKQLREAREAMATDSEWFREQTALLEKELEQEEKLRSSVSSQHSLPRLSVNGLPMANGYEFVPAPDKPGVPLSRTEHRIRATGAHGLAYKPIGGQSSYTPVAMSRRSALRYSQAMYEEAVGKIPAMNGLAQRNGQRHNSDVETTYPPVTEVEDEEEEEEEEEDEENEGEIFHQAQSKAAQAEEVLKSRFSVPRKSAPSERALQNNQFALLQEPSDGDSDADTEAEEIIEDDAQPDVPDHLVQDRYYSYGAQASLEGNGTDDLYEAEEEESEDDLLEDEEEDDYEDEDEDGAEGDYDDDDEDGHGLLHPSLRPQYHHAQRSGYYGTPEDDADTPATQLSRASSGPGASADDALVLSD